MKKAIGGYFELELRQGEHYHKNAIMLNTARNCLEYILKAKEYAKIYIPYYTCEVVLEPIKKHNIEFEFYSINENLEPVRIYLLKVNEAFLYTNYFGLKQNTVKKLAETYGNQLIVDNSQAFFAERLNEIDTFYSARKFFGVADGAYLYTDSILNEDFQQDFSCQRMSHLFKRIDLGADDGYDDFRQNDRVLSEQPIMRMSNLTEGILKSIDYEFVKQKRQANYKILDEKLSNNRQINFKLDDNIPMVYPLLCENGKTVKGDLIKNRVYVPTYWVNVKEWTSNIWENNLVDNLVCLPIDQRYGEKEIKEIISIWN
jgi:hypothetical protein